LFLFLLITIFQLNQKQKRLQFANSEKQRYFNNWIASQKEVANNSVQVYRQKEITGNLRLQIDSLGKILKVKPKEIEKIVEKTITIRDTIRVPVPVQPNGQDSWLITDVGKCFKWEGDVYLRDDSLKVWRSSFDYHNKTTDVFYRKRPKHFLFIKFGRWQNLHETSSECGEVITKEFNFLK
jgi:hypothetical protein